MRHLAMAIVIKNDTVLLQRRLRPGKGMVFEFPGGSVESRESGIEAAKRELFEETKLTARSVVGCHSATNQYGGDIHYVILTVDPDAEPQPDSQRQQSFYWLTVDQVPLADMYPSDINFIRTHLTPFVTHYDAAQTA